MYFSVLSHFIQQSYLNKLSAKEFAYEYFFSVKKNTRVKILAISQSLSLNQI